MKQKSGFTLAELSVVLVIISLIVGMTVASGVSVINSARLVATNNKMAAINQALMAFRVANDRIPCPSDLSQAQGSATYGAEGACTAIAGGVFVAKNGSATATAAEGGIPTVTLGLPNDFMYDGWGNRFRYAVDTGMTATGSFSGSQIGCVDGAITINTGGIVAYPAAIPISTGAIYALISHGANGHGAVTKNAVVYDGGSLNTDELTNCHCTSTGAAGTYAPVYVQEAPYTYKAIAKPNSNYNFDDIVTYKERWQMQTAWDKAGTGCSGGVYYRTITIDHTKVGTVNNTDQTNFPMLFSGTYSYLANSPTGVVTNTNGYDITFTSDAAGKIVLPFERESYNATDGAVTFWVQVPLVSHTTDTVIYLQYDNAAITTDQSNQHGTWNSNYRGVWHLGEASGSPQDSTSYASNGTITGTVTQGATGVFGTAISLNGVSGNYVVVTNPTDHHLDFGTGSFSTSVWVNETSTPAAYYAFISKGGGGVSDTGYQTYADSIPAYAINITDGTHDVLSDDVPISNSTWYHLVQTVDKTANQMHFYLNGAEYSGSPYSVTSIQSTTTVVNLFMGANDDGNSVLNGKEQEIHIISGAESADWVKTEYNNQHSPSTFYTVGAQTSR